MTTLTLEPKAAPIEFHLPTVVEARQRLADVTAAGMVLHPTERAAYDRVYGKGWTEQRGSHDHMFDKHLGSLLDYVAAHGQIPTQHVFVDGFGLGLWVKEQRRRYRAGILAPDRVVALEAIPGWQWAPPVGRPVNREVVG